MTCECSICGAEFEYEQDDGMNVTSDGVAVVCPECGAELVILIHERKE